MPSDPKYPVLSSTVPQRGVSDEAGNPIVSEDSDGSSSSGFDPGWADLVYFGVRNGSFSQAPPLGVDVPIERGLNDLPGWDGPTVAAGGAAYAVAHADATAPSGQVLRQVFPKGTANGDRQTFSQVALIGGNGAGTTGLVSRAYAKAAAGNGADSVTAVLSIQPLDNAAANLGAASSSSLTLAAAARDQAIVAIDASPGSSWRSIRITLDVTLAAAGATAAQDVILDWTDVRQSLAGADKQVFTANGTWTKPAGRSMARVICIGGGGGGGSGRRGVAGTVRAGGGAGGAGGYSFADVPLTDLPNTLSVHVGAGGVGAPANTVNDTNGATGGDGDDSFFGTGPNFILAALRGAAGGGGTNAGNPANGGAGGGGVVPGGAGGSGRGGTNGDNGTNGLGPGGGGGGGGVDATNTAWNGGNGGMSGHLLPPYVNGGAFGADGGAGTASTFHGLGSGGGGGGGGAAAASGAGGVGGIYGAGGGGGGGVLNGFSGKKGADGAAGIVIVICT